MTLSRMSGTSLVMTATGTGASLTSPVSEKGMSVLLRRLAPVEQDCEFSHERTALGWGKVIGRRDGGGTYFTPMAARIHRDPARESHRYGTRPQTKTFRGSRARRDALDATAAVDGRGVRRAGIGTSFGEAARRA